MATITKIEDMEIWQLARILAKDIGDLTDSEIFKEELALKKQIRTSSGSIMDNIAEGFGRASRNEFINHLTIARGSAQETKSQLYRCQDHRLIDRINFQKLLDQSETLINRISGLISYLVNTQLKGPKFRGR